MKNILLTFFTIIVTSVFTVAQFSITTSDKTACSGKSKILKATKGPQYSNYKWYDPGVPGTLGTADSVVLNSLLQGNNQISVSALLNGTTVVGDTVDVFQFKSPTVTLNYDTYLQCKGDSVLVKDENTAGGSFDYTWSNGRTGTSLSSLYLKQAGTYTVIKKGPFPSNCTGTDAITINHQLLPNVTIEGRKTICVGDPVNLEANLTETPTGTVSYEWQDNTGTVLSSTEVLETTTNSSSSYKLKLTETATLTCSDSSYVYIDVNPVLEATTELNDTTICLGENYTIDSPVITGGNGGPYMYSWSLNDETIGSNVALNFTPSESGTVYLSVSDANECIYSDHFELNLKDIQFSVSDKDSLFICEGDSIVLSPVIEQGVEPYTYLWTLPDNSTSAENSLLIKNELGEYSLKLTDAIGCFDYDTVQINAASGIKPVISEITGPSEITYEESATYTITAQTDNFELIATSDGLGEIEIDEKRFTYLPSEEEEEEATMMIEIFNVCGSDDSSFVLQVVAPEIIENILFIPNTVVLSASKEESKVFKVYSETIVNQGFELKIFNSKGNLVFEETDYSDLRSNGWKPEQNQLNFTGNNVFTYITKGVFENGESFDKTGTITVVQ